jgi:hypothetical protein
MQSLGNNERKKGKFDDNQQPASSKRVDDSQQGPVDRLKRCIDVRIQLIIKCRAVESLLISRLDAANALASQLT